MFRCLHIGGTNLSLKCSQGCSIYPFKNTNFKRTESQKNPKAKAQAISILYRNCNSPLGTVFIDIINRVTHLIQSWRWCSLTIVIIQNEWCKALFSTFFSDPTLNTVLLILPETFFSRVSNNQQVFTPASLCYWGDILQGKSSRTSGFTWAVPRCSGQPRQWHFQIFSITGLMWIRLFWKLNKGSQANFAVLKIGI